MSKIYVDGNGAASRVAYALSDSAAIYPITPSSTMAENYDEWSENGDKNIFGVVPTIVEMQSEAGAAGTLHGMLSSGNLAVTFTASQGLLLMIPTLYKLSGEQLPAVLHVSARALSTHALSIFGDHSDIYACRQTGCLMLASSCVQEAQDLAAIAHLVAVETSLPVIHFFDGFRTSHEICDIEELTLEELNKLINEEKIAEFKSKALSPASPICQGTAQNPDIYFQNREALNPYYFSAEEKISKIFNQFKTVTGRSYDFFSYYGVPNAKEVIVIMGSAAKVFEDLAYELKVGVICVNVYRPFSLKHFLKALPKNTKRICVLDRTKEPGAAGEPLYTEICSLVVEGNISATVIGGRYGLGGKDFTPDNALSVIENLKAKTPKNHFTVGINDDVTFTSLNAPTLKAVEDTSYTCKFYGLGSDGTVSANKNSIKIIGQKTNKHTQGYFEYDSKKSGSITVSHLRISDKPILAPYLITKADFIACHEPALISRFNILENLKQNGIVLINTDKNDHELALFLPEEFKDKLRSTNSSLYTIDAFKIAAELKLGSRINTTMQSAFFKLTNLINFDVAKSEMKAFARKTYAKKGDHVISANEAAIEKASDNLHKVNINDLFETKTNIVKENVDKYYKEFIKPILELKGDELPVSTFAANGQVPTNTSRLEKRGIAINIPKYIIENCIGCNQCAFVCPHACVRPVLVKDEDLKNAPDSFVTKETIGLNGLKYRIQISPKDCTGCGSCANVCPALKKALQMVPAKELPNEEKNYEFSLSLPKIDLPSTSPLNVRNSQFKQPLFEFSSACAGCGETPYIKLLTQLFGDHLVIANATGCSSIYGGNAPTTPYAKNKKGRGPVWASSLFEDNAEFGFGMYLAYKTKRQIIWESVTAMLEKVSTEEKAILKRYLDNFKNFQINEELESFIIAIAKKLKNSDSKQLLKNKEAICKQTFWLVGGDGWAYDIGFGGLDHVLASNEDINVLVLDSEVYSNTGGQASKATPLGASAKFASGGKRTNKKSLTQIAMTYKSVFVSQIAMGANYAQTLNAFVEAEKFDGPSLIVAYSTCINQGIDMSQGMLHMREGVECGYINLFTYNPSSEQKFKLQSSPPSKSLAEFAYKEVRFKSLERKKPLLEKKLLSEAEEFYKQRYEDLKKLEEQLK